MRNTRHARAHIWLLAMLLLAASLATFGEAAAQPATPTSDSVPGTTFLLAPEGGSDLEAVRVELEPGTTTTVTILLGTDDSGPVDLRTYAADAYTKVNGGYAARDESTDVQPPTTWLDYPAATITLAANQILPQQLTITVPGDTEPGQYVAAIVAQTAEPLTIPGSSFLNQVIRKSIPVIITLPGDVTVAASLGSPDVTATEAGSILVVPIENTGTIRIRPVGTLTLTDTTGTDVLTAPIAMGPVYAGHSTTLELTLPAQIVPGDYTLRLDLTDEEGTGWTSTLAGVALAVPTLPDVAATPVPTPVTIATAEVTTGPTDSNGSPAYADLAVSITNQEQPIPSSTLTLVVMRDGTEVERLPIGQNLALLTAETSLNYRYIPTDGWETGAYTFELTLEATDPGTGTSVMLTTAPVNGTVTVP